MKKKQTPDEQLQQALVPKQDWPYDVPGTWCWVHLLETFENKTDSKRKVKTKEYLENGILPVIDQSQIFINGYTDNESMAYQGSLPVIIFGDHTRNIKYVDFNFAQGADGVKVLKSKPFFHPKAFYYALKNLNIPNLGYRRHFPLFPKFMLPLPPFNEQKRIIAEVEKMYAKLDEAQEKIESVVASFETRKAAILHAAFTGKLTAKWREEQGIDFSDWNDIALQDVCKSIFDGDHMPPPKTASGIPFLVISNVNQGKLNFDNTRFVPQEYYDALTATRRPEAGDILYTLVGSYGIPVLVDTNRYFCFQRHMGLLKLNGKAEQKYMWYVLQTKEFFNKATKIAKGTAQLTVPIKGLRQLTIPVPPRNEQREIVRLLDNLLAKESAAKEKAEAVLGQIDTLKKSILARAFRGQLGTTDPSDTPAIEELKQYFATH